MNPRDIQFVSLAFTGWVIFMQIPFLNYINYYFICLILGFSSSPKKYYVITMILIFIYLFPSMIYSIGIINPIMDSYVYTRYEVHLPSSLIPFWLPIYYSMLAWSFILEYLASNFTIKHLKLKERIGYL